MEPFEQADGGASKSMSFLFRARRPKLTDAPDDLAPARPPAPVSQSIVFVGAAESLVADVAAGEERVTDLLNRDALPTPFDDVLLVVPPPRTTDPRRRLHRPRRGIEVQIGPFEVQGTMHVPPGAQAAGYLARVNPRFVPVTQAIVRRPEESHPDWFAEVVLLSVAHMRGLVEDGRPTGVEAPVEELEPA